MEVSILVGGLDRLAAVVHQRLDAHHLTLLFLDGLPLALGGHRVDPAIVLLVFPARGLLPTATCSSGRHPAVPLTDFEHVLLKRRIRFFENRTIDERDPPGPLRPAN